MNGIEDSRLAMQIVRDGFAFVEANAMRDELESAGSIADWPVFAASWNDMPLDAYMADGGRYRRRLHAVFSAGDSPHTLTREPHQPHYQSLDYNRLNGGVARWFEPIRDDIGASASLRTILDFCHALAAALSPQIERWHIEVHQMRIEAASGVFGLPTPEGLHRDGVDHVLVLLIARCNIAQGTTTIHDLDRRTIGSFTLTAPFDSALVDDARVYHGVTAVEPIDTGLPAHRDVLIVTFRKA